MSLKTQNWKMGSNKRNKRGCRNAHPPFFVSFVTHPLSLAKVRKTKKTIKKQKIRDFLISKIVLDF
jgi:hypothetical protein